jgi:TFIIF-interacting CTD phosphatase-like protein
MTKNNTKPHIFLDLDQTLISAEASEEHDFDKYKEKSKKFSFEDMDSYYIIFARPGLQKFLTYLFDNFNVSIWTAASKDYAVFIIDKLILKDHPDRKLDFILFSYHCDISYHKKDSSKDLSMLWDVYKLKGYNKDNTIILDDYSEVYQTQPNNCVIAIPFNFTKNNSENDDFLIKLIPELEKMKNKMINSNSINTNNINKILSNKLITKFTLKKEKGKALSRSRRKID